MKLTKAQARLVAMLAEGKTQAEACMDLGIKYNTGTVHVRGAKAANSCRTLAHLTAKYAAHHGVSSEPDPLPAPVPVDDPLMHPWRESFKKHNSAQP